MTEHWGRSLIPDKYVAVNFAKENLSLIRLSLNSRLLFFYERNLCLSVDLFTVSHTTVLHKAIGSDSNSLLTYDALMFHLTTLNTTYNHSVVGRIIMLIPKSLPH